MKCGVPRMKLKPIMHLWEPYTLLSFSHLLAINGYIPGSYFEEIFHSRFNCIMESSNRTINRWMRYLCFNVHEARNAALRWDSKIKQFQRLIDQMNVAKRISLTISKERSSDIMLSIVQEYHRPADTITDINFCDLFILEIYCSNRSNWFSKNDFPARFGNFS